jgi:hypothetical protein
LAGPFGLAGKAMDQEHFQEVEAPHIRPARMLQARDNCVQESPLNNMDRTAIRWGRALGREALISGARGANIFTKPSHIRVNLRFPEVPQPISTAGVARCLPQADQALTKRFAVIPIPTVRAQPRFEVAEGDLWRGQYDGVSGNPFHLLDKVLPFFPIPFPGLRSALSSCLFFLLLIQY